AKLAADRADMAHRAVLAIGGHETDTGFRKRPLGQLEIDFCIDAEYGLHIGSAGARRGRLVAMLGDGHARACGNERRCGRDIERPVAITARADHIDSIFGRLDIGRFFAQDRNAADQLIDRFAAKMQPHQERAHLRRRRIARKDNVESGLRLFYGKGFARRDPGDQRLEVGLFSAHAAALLSGRVRSRKLRSSACPCSDAMLSGWNCTPWIGSDLWLRPMITPSAVVAVTSSVLGTVAGSTVSE